MTSFYVSPSALTCRQYKELVKDTAAFGWKPTYIWPSQCFHEGAFISNHQTKRALKAISRTDIFIATLPGTSSSMVEIGLAYTLCEVLFLVAKDPVHFTQTGMGDAYISVLPGIKRVRCEFGEIASLLRQEFNQLISQN